MSISFPDLAAVWRPGDRLGVADLFEDRERREAVTALLQDRPLATIVDCAELLFTHGFLEFPLSWDQTESELEVAFIFPPNIKSNAILVIQGSSSVTIAIKGWSKPILDDAVFHDKVIIDDSQWTLERRASTTLLKLDMAKTAAIWWPELFQGDGVPQPPCQTKLSATGALAHARALDRAGAAPDQVFSMYKAAADAGHAESANRVANAFIEGDRMAGVAPDINQAVHYLLMAAEGGHPESMFQIAHAFHQGAGVERDFDRAAFWYRSAWDAEGDVRAAYFLGHIYHHFPGRVPEPDQAARWWKCSADQGHPDSMFNLGLYFHKGAGVPQSDAKAVELLKKATDANPSFIELLNQNAVDLQKLEESLAPPKKTRRRRTRKASSRSSSSLHLAAALTAIGVLGAVAWLHRDSIRDWIVGDSNDPID